MLASAQSQTRRGVTSGEPTMRVASPTMPPTDMNYTFSQKQRCSAIASSHPRNRQCNLSGAPFLKSRSALSHHNFNLNNTPDSNLTASVGYLASQFQPPLATRPPRTRLPAPPSSASMAPPSTEQQPSQPQPATVEACDALIVGAGPAGLATALLLARRKGWGRIILLDQRPSLDAEESDKSYVYSIDWRGRGLTDEAGVTAAVMAAGVATKSIEFTQVLPDGSAKSSTMTVKDDQQVNVWLPRRAFLAALYSGLRQAESTGQVRLLQATQLTSILLAARSCSPSPSASSSSTSSTSTASPPAGMTSTYTVATRSGDSPASVSTSTSTNGAPQKAPIVVTARDMNSGRELSFAPRLLVGADGVHSVVRRALEGWAPAVGLSPEHYRPVVLHSHSAGLRYKVLSLPPNTPFRKPPKTGTNGTDGTNSSPYGGSSSSSSKGTGGIEAVAAEVAGRLKNHMFGKIVGVPAPRNRRMQLGMLPIADPAARRTANVIGLPDHAFWGLTSGPQLRAYLEASFPQLDIPALFSEQQLQAAAGARGGVFPAPQYLRHFTALLQPPPAVPADSATAAAGGNGGGGCAAKDGYTDRATASDGPATPAAAAGAPAADAVGAAAAAAPAAACGVVLVGDAVHCFPPDLGQGVNSALQDVQDLARALDEAGGEVASALPRFEACRAPEARALARLMTFSFPYQYNQYPLLRALWTLNFALRAALSRLAPRVFHPHSFVLVQQPGLSYEQILERAHATTARICTLAGALVAAVLALVCKAAVATARNGAVA